MRTALLISTYNWPESLDLVLKSLCRQSQMPDEVLIADDGSGVETKKLIQEYVSRIPTKLHHVWHMDDGFRKSVILNKAVAQSSADFIIQVDGDCILHPHFIRDCIRAAEPGVLLSGTRVNIKEAFLSELWRSRATDFQVFHPGLRNGLRGLHYPLLGRFYRKRRQFSKKFRGCNTAYWRSDFLRVNGYNEAFMGWGREDSDLARRLIHSGCALKRLKHRALVYHIPHKIRSKSNLTQNDGLELKTIKERITHIEKGVDQYLKGSD